MGTKFHCKYCGKKIVAPDKAAGKWGKCPKCNSKLYIPGDTSDAEDFKLEPLNSNEEKKREKLMQETFQLSQIILKQKKLPKKSSLESLSYEDLQNMVIKYLVHMSNGQLDQAKNLIEQIASDSDQTSEILDKIAFNQITNQELDSLPPQVLATFIRQLRNYIS